MSSRGKFISQNELASLTEFCEAKAGYKAKYWGPPTREN